MKTARVIHPRNSRCALCGKSKDQVEKLIVGLHGAVCTDCVELCNDIVDPSRAKREVNHENPFEVLIAREPDAKLPCYQTSGAAGMDLRSIEEVELQPMQRMLVRTGLRIAIPPGFEGQVRPRSGLALKHGITMVNSPGTIDSDYRGEVAVIAINLGQSVVKLERGERIAQLVIAPVARAALVEVESLDETDRGDGGFGSTGTR